MDEYQIWSNMNSGLISNAIYFAGIAFLLWVAFRAANQMRAEDAGVFNKTLVSLFSLGIIFSIDFFGAGKSILFKRKKIPAITTKTKINLIKNPITLLLKLVFLVNCI